MAMTRDQIIVEINAYIRNNGTRFQNWYVGVTANPRNRLFNDHSVREKADAWIFRKTTSSFVAREVESYFIYEMGTQGGTGGGDANSRFVYAYKTRPHTRQ